ncbi:MAG: TonB family protein [Proteobacteria bacterium]|nr:TonB family protein [Pseudomonadota bacterium]
MIILAAALLAEVVPPKPIGDPGQWISSSDYPAGALAKAASGSTIVELMIDTDGRISQCRVDTSSGSIELDATACALIKARGRFTPGKDASGRRIEGIYRQRVAWVMPRDVSIPLPATPESLAIAVDVDSKGLVERCDLLEGGELVAQGAPNPCIRYPAGAKLRTAAGSDGRPIAYRIVMRQSTEVTAR